MGYERQIYPLIDCYVSLGGVSAPIRVTGYWLYPLGCTKRDLSIQEGHQYYWCMLLLSCNVHVDISHKEHVWCLTDIFVDESVARWLVVEETPVLSITASAAETIMVSPTKMMLALQLLSKNTSWDSSMLSSVYKNARDGVWHNMSPGDGGSSNS